MVPGNVHSVAVRSDGEICYAGVSFGGDVPELPSFAAPAQGTLSEPEEEPFRQTHKNEPYQRAYSCNVAQGQTWLGQGTLDVLVIIIIWHYLVN